MAQQQEERKVRLSMKMLAGIMKEIDFCMLTTVGAYGRLHSRPMSNNRNVDWDGETWFFADASSSQVREIEREPNVNLAYAVPDEIVFVSVTGRATIVTDGARKKALWHDELERWFPGGPEDEKVVLIRVDAKYVYYWSKDGDGDMEL